MRSALLRLGGSTLPRLPPAAAPTARPPSPALRRRAAAEDWCAYRVEDWWTYEVCYRKHVRQYHKEQGKVVSEYLLGAYSEADSDVDRVQARAAGAGWRCALCRAGRGRAGRGGVERARWRGTLNGASGPAASWATVFIRFERQGEARGASTLRAGL